MTEPLTVGFAGAGFIGQLAHLYHYATLDGCEVVALAEPRSTLAERVATRHGIPETYPDHEAMLADRGPDLDCVVAVQHYSLHRAIVPDVLEAELPLFTEKPLARNVESGEALADAADRTGVPHMVGYHKRSDPGMERAVDVIAEWRESGAYGDLQYVRMAVPHGDWTDGVPDPITTDEAPPDTDRDPLPAEFDAEDRELFDHVINFYSHQFNALRAAFGESYEVALADDSGSLLAVESASGLPGALEMVPYETTADWQESLLVCFEHGYVRVDFAAPLARQEGSEVKVLRAPPDGEQTTTRPATGNVSAMRNQARNFLAVARGERDPPSDSRKALADLRIAREYVRRRTA
jgi:predicted dehydrogenase